MKYYAPGRMDRTPLQFDDCWTAVEDGCHVWTGASLYSSGYGQFRKQHAHRWLYQQAHHLTDDQMPPMVCHVCDVRACVNERHLFPGTAQDNMDDMWAKGRGVAGRSKLTSDQVREIRESPMMGSAMARLYGVSDAVISKVRLRRTYRDV